MKDFYFGMMPSEWIYSDVYREPGWGQAEGGLVEFGATRRTGDLALKLTALKLYLAIVCKAGTPDRDPPGEVRLDYSTLEEVADVARGLISPGLEKLNRLVEVERGGGRKPSLYRLRNFPRRGRTGEPKFAKVPVARVLRSLSTGSFSARSRTDLDALRLYLTLLRFRDDVTNLATMAYEKLSHHSGVPRYAISRAISVLVETDLVTSRRGESPEGMDAVAACNRYSILGLFPKPRKKSPFLSGASGIVSAD